MLPRLIMNKKTGLLLVNLGTPDEPTTAAVRRYLRVFLSDSRVITLPRIPWRILLNTLILPLRSPVVAKKYREIWGAGGSPLRMHSLALGDKLSAELGMPVAVGMRYGQPSLKDALLQLRQTGIDNLIVLPLFPQFSSATSASVFDAVTAAFRPCPHLPAFHFIPDYHDQPDYIACLAGRIKAQWAKQGRAQKLLIFFHGLPQRMVDQGDPYQRQCQQTAQLLAENLALSPAEWELAYQSRFGKTAWLQPYGIERIKKLPLEGTTSVELISPGFATDCLETLEELNIQYREQFIAAGGKSYHYISALNSEADHVTCMANIIRACHVQLD